MAGLVSDYTGGRATTCCVMLLGAAPMVSVIQQIKLFYGSMGVDTFT